MRVKIIASVIILSLVGCGGSSSNNNNPSETSLAANLETAAGGLVPLMTGSGNSSVSDFAISYGEDSSWAIYLDADLYYVLTDVFGDPNVEPAVVTKIRVLLDQFTSRLSDIISSDADLTCTGAGATAFSGSDEIQIAFYGTVSNGTSSDRLFDCLLTSASETILYGQDASGILYVAQMSDTTSTNTEETSTRGDQETIKQVVLTRYLQQTESGNTAAYLDMQYAQSTIYNGVDDDFDATDDNVVFKSRSRITGRVVLDSSGALSDAAGDFSVTKYDQGVNQDLSTYTIVTQTMGRGEFGTDQFSIFTIDSNAGSLSGTQQTFCIQQTSSGLPANADSTNCTAYESAYAWSTTFPFTPAPAIPESFEAKDFFAGDNTDMIANDGSNFTIPTY